MRVLVREVTRSSHLQERIDALGLWELDHKVDLAMDALRLPPGVSGTYQVEPWVHADEAGVFHAIWYDDRENPNTSIFHIYYSQSTDNGQTWTQAVRISTAMEKRRSRAP